MSKKELERRVDEVLEWVGLTDRADDRISSYSGGMKRRINIAASLLHNPRLIYMDEPTVGLDPQSRRNLLDMVRALNRQGMTVLYTTHYMEEAQELSDRVGIIDHGALIALGTQEELTRLVGENETLRLRFGETQPLDELAQSIEALPGVAQVSVAEGEVVVIVPDAEVVLPEIIRRANELGVHIRSINIEEPNLESVFLHLTGRALRD
jgi:ABC-2 type transport system ATP-binding protein